MGEPTRHGLEDVVGLAKHFTIETLREHLLSHAVRTDSGCLEYEGYGDNRRVHQKMVVRAWAHHAAYVTFIGPRDPALEISHLCNNPPCIEPSHLMQETHAANMGRRIGRVNRVSCEHPRERHPETGKLMQCKPCNSDAQRRWRERQRQELDLAKLYGATLNL